MIHKVSWQDRRDAGLKTAQTPFSTRLGTPKIRLTFHADGLIDLPKEEQIALERLLQLSEVGAIDSLYSVGQGSPFIEIQIDTNKEKIRVIKRDENNEGISFTGVNFRNARSESLSLYSNEHFDAPSEDIIFRDIVFAMAHESQEGDILVTNAPWLVNHQYGNLSNPRTPTQAAKIVGLHLRANNQFFYLMQPDLQKVEMSSYGFYNDLALQMLPNSRSYIRAIRAFEQDNNDNSNSLASSLLSRTSHVLRARDYLGAIFYGPASYSSLQETLYHFMTLLLQLSGAIDAQLRVAHRAYNLASKERYANPRNEGFLSELNKNGATSLHKLLIERRGLLNLIYEIRNTIHQAEIPGFENQDYISESSNIIYFDWDFGKVLYESVHDYGGPEAWGIRKHGYYERERKPENHRTRLEIEPFAYASKATIEGLSFLDEIAKTIKTPHSSKDYAFRQKDQAIDDEDLATFLKVFG